MAVLLYKMGMSHIEERNWNKREFQDHFIIPEIGSVISTESKFGGVSRFMNEDQNATVIFWLSLLERTSLSSVYMDVRDGFNSKTGEVELRKSRVSRYLVSTDGLVKNLEFIADKEFKKDQRRNIKNNFSDFLNQIRGYEEVHIIKEKLDNKGIVENVVLEISANRYFQVNEFLYDKAINKSKKDFRFIKNSVAVFITVMRSAKKKIMSGVIDTEIDKKSKESKMRLISGKKDISEQKAFKGLSYKKIESNVCFRYIGSIADSLGMNRKTVANQIQFLSDNKILSYVVLREWNNSSEMYFITDSFSEYFLSDYLLNGYRSHYCYDIVEISSFYGRAYSLESSNKPSDNYEKVDIEQEKFKRARMEFEMQQAHQSM